MKKKIKKAVAIILTVAVTMSVGVPAFAEENNSENILKLPQCNAGDQLSLFVDENIEFIETYDGKLIPVEQILHFDSREEANAFIETFNNSLNDQEVQSFVINPNLRTTYGDAIVDEDDTHGDGKIELRVSYVTSGDGNTGVVTEHDAYTVLTGFNLGFSWDEYICTSQLTETGKDIYAYARGVIEYYLIIEGLINIYDAPVTLSGTLPVIR